MTPSQGEMRLKSALQKFNILMAKATTFSTASETKSETKSVNNSESKSKIKLRSGWTVSLVLLISAVICV